MYKQLIQPVIYVLCLSAAIAGCAPAYYVPNTQHVPLFRQKGEVITTIAGTHERFEFQAAAAISKQQALYASYISHQPKPEASGDRGKGRIIELGNGYYWLLQPHITGGFTGFLGYGKFENYFPSQVTLQMPEAYIKGNFTRLCMQPYIGYHSKYIESVFSVRWANINYYNVKGVFSYNSGDEVKNLQERNYQAHLEPALTLRGGFNSLFLQIQAIKSININNASFRYQDSYLTLGILYYFGRQRVTGDKVN